MGKNKLAMMMAVLLCAAMAAQAQDTFGTGANQFTIDFVSISGDTNPGSGYGIVRRNYRMGVYEITLDQWRKFTRSVGSPVTGYDGFLPGDAYDDIPYFTYVNQPNNEVSWYEAAQFVNYLNTSTGHQAAYKFTGTQGTGDYTFATWSAAEASRGTNLYRHKDAFYFLPTEDEWVKAAYWNGAALQTYATKAGETVHQGDGVSGTGWNYSSGGEQGGDLHGLWDVGSGSEELNGTFDMMGNAVEWMESPQDDPNYGVGAMRCTRAGSVVSNVSALASSHRGYDGTNSYLEATALGFRVASVPEPATMSLLAMGGLAMLRVRRGGRRCK